MKISFIGFGNMAKAIAKNLNQHDCYQLFAASPSLPDTTQAEGLITHFDNIQIVKEADVVIIAVKPVNVVNVLTEISAHLPKHSVLVSIVAGLSLAKISQCCQDTQAIIRAMPNLPIAAGFGATALIANNHVDDKQKLAVEKIFQQAGITYWINNEKEMNALTALSGSGPAYVFLFMEAMVTAAEKLGLDSQLANSFMLQTVAGAVALAKTSGTPLNELRQKVTSKAGTTAAALAILQQNDIETLIFNAMKAAYERALQLNEALIS